MSGALLAAGCSEAPTLEDARLIVINSCSIREAAEQKVIGRMGLLARLKAADPSVRVVLTGCSVRADNEAILARRYPAVDLFLRPDEEAELVARLGLAGPTTPGELSGPGFQRVGRSVAAVADRLPSCGRQRWRRDVSRARVARGRGCPSSTAATRPAPTASCPSLGDPNAVGPSTTSWPRPGAWRRPGAGRSPCSGRTSTPGATTCHPTRDSRTWPASVSWGAPRIVMAARTSRPCCVPSMPSATSAGDRGSTACGS